MCDSYSDLYKDAFGCRPSSNMMQSFYSMSNDEQDAECSSLSERVSQRIAEEKAMQVEAVREFEALVLKTIVDGAKNRATAIKWLADADNCLDDAEHFCWKNGLPLDYIKSFD
jgi:hypothetical protein